MFKLIVNNFNSYKSINLKLYKNERETNLHAFHPCRDPPTRALPVYIYFFF